MNGPVCAYRQVKQLTQNQSPDHPTGFNKHRLKVYESVKICELQISEAKSLVLYLFLIKAAYDVSPSLLATSKELISTHFTKTLLCRRTYFRQLKGEEKNSRRC